MVVGNLGLGFQKGILGRDSRHASFVHVSDTRVSQNDDFALGV